MDGLGGVGVSPPHETPLKVKAVGAVLVPEYVAWKPNRADAPVASGPFQPALAAVTTLPVWVTVAFQPPVTRSSPANVQDSDQEVTGAPPLVTWMSAVNPVAHWLAVQPTVHTGAAGRPARREWSAPGRPPRSRAA